MDGQLGMKRTFLVYLLSASFFLLLVPPKVVGQDGIIPYQQLTRDNFRGAPDHLSFLKAYTKAGIKWDWSFTTITHDDVRYECRLDNIKYESYFDENNSWWKGDRKSGNILRHEQGHLDIVELLARELNKNKRSIMDRFKGEGDSFEEAKADLERKLAEYHQQHVLEEVIRRSAIYDDETEQSKNIARQEEWNIKLREALRQ